MDNLLLCKPSIEQEAILQRLSAAPMGSWLIISGALWESEITHRLTQVARVCSTLHRGEKCLYAKDAWLTGTTVPVGLARNMNIWLPNGRDLPGPNWRDSFFDLEQQDRDDILLNRVFRAPQQDGTFYKLPGTHVGTDGSVLYP